MREIKFRAWDNKNMWHDVAVYNGLPYVWNNQETELVPLQALDQEIRWSNAILMQYTGLKDQNGKEIYEWDIVTLHYEVEEKYCILPIIFNTGAFGWKRKDGFEAFIGWYGSDIEIADDVEIIGNIYQNPELLEAAND